MKRNIVRFLDDFMFQLTREEIPESFLKSQIVTLKEDGSHNVNLKSQIATSSWGGKRKLPYAFTEQGIYMLATVLREELAEQQSIFIMQAIKSIYVIDNYMNTKTLQLLSQKIQGVEVILFTENGHGKKGFLTEAVVNDFRNQYPPLQMKANPDCHDRWIVLDYGIPTEQAYHCGASSKDAGKKLCAINKLEDTTMIHPMIDKLLAVADVVI